MDLIIGFIFDFGWWITGIGVLICMIVGLWGVVRWSKAQGDSGKGGGARLAMFGGGIGVVAVPVALIAFRIFSADVIDQHAGLLPENCDGKFREQLQMRPNVTTAADAKGLMAAMHSSLQGRCAAYKWMGRANTALTATLKDPLAASGAGDSCGYMTASALVKRAVKAAMTDGYARIGGAIVIAFDVSSTHADHLDAAVDSCWIFDSSSGWHVGGNT